MSQRFRESGLPVEDARRFNDLDCSGDPGLTTQADTEAVNINTIVRRMQKGQAVPVVNGEPFYGDVSEFTGLQDALIKVQEANELFMAYPAELRERFDNDPVQFVDFMSDPENTDEAVKLGLAVKRPVPEQVPPTSEAPPASDSKPE